jgi:hypothetical protein
MQRTTDSMLLLLNQEQSKLREVCSLVDTHNLQTDLQIFTNIIIIMVNNMHTMLNNEHFV